MAGARRFLSTRCRGGITLCVLVVAAWALLVEPGWVAQRTLTLASPHWQGPPLRLAFVADLHAGSPHVDQAALRELVARINAARPELVLLGGDFAVNRVLGGTPMSPAGLTESLAGLTAPLGVFAVLGNHDWWAGADPIRQALTAAGIEVLENRAVLLPPAQPRLALVGLGDDSTGHADPALAHAGLPPALNRLVLMHDPANYPELPGGHALALAGHTHGGQVALPGLGALIVPGRAPRRHAYGLIEETGSPLYVTTGIGTSILPVRLFARPEFLILTLTPAPS